ncbi:CopG family transcriptional regulator [Geminocystis sp. CENA526]|uniref:type II toxin-antitoxin system MazE family antitoxin n=1 Tax=Geminocystis sp. CENA526 TaxID=1355871 RepID=UPI003D6DDEFB
MKKVTITLEEKVLEFVDRQAKGHRSNYINQLLKENHQKQLEKEMIEALQEDIKNQEYQEEIQAWNTVIGDGNDPYFVTKSS